MTVETSSLFAVTFTRVLGVPAMDDCTGPMLGGPPAPPCWATTLDGAGGSAGGALTDAPTM
jgi:hypothetical protein